MRRAYRGYIRDNIADPLVQARDQQITTMINVKMLDLDLDRIEFALAPRETRSAFIRTAIENELRTRHRQSTALKRAG